MKGMEGGWREFRYGEGTKRPIHVPGRGKPSRASIKGQRRQHVLDELKAILGEWTQSKFEFEAASRHGLRAGLCLEGVTWGRADLEAERLVAEALAAIGARRPSWEEGQRQYTESPDRCLWCSGPMGEGNRAGSRYCGRECAGAALEHFSRKSNAYVGEFVRAAKRLIAREESPARNCRHCGNAFQSDDLRASFCSPRCVSHHQKGASLLTSQSCPECQVVFHPQNRGQKFCSHICDTTARRREVRSRLATETRECACCQEPFTPTTEDNIYCSKRCAHAAANKAYRERKGPSLHQCQCRLCGTSFASKMPWASYCSTEHKKMADSILRPRTYKPKPLSVMAFDLVFSKAA